MSFLNKRFVIEPELCVSFSFFENVKCQSVFLLLVLQKVNVLHKKLFFSEHLGSFLPKTNIYKNVSKFLAIWFIKKIKNES